MNKVTYITIIAFLAIAFTACQNKDDNASSTQVKYSGALRSIMSGDIKPVINLDTLSKRKNLYALGAVGGLKGEIQIFDSQPSNSFVVDSNLLIKESYNLKASLLVYAQVKEWESFELENSKTKSDLEKQIFELAKENGTDTEQPFPFLLEGVIASIDWHVIHWNDGDTIHNHKKHKESGLNGTLQNREVQIIGFYSSKHKSVFTHHTTNMHMHFKTDNIDIAGHIDDLSLNQPIIVKLPKQ